MTSAQRFVLDTSVVVGDLLRPAGAARPTLDHAFGAGTVLASTATLRELAQVLERPKFARYFAPGALAGQLAAYAAAVALVEVAEVAAACRDSGDDVFLALARSGGATWLVSNDTDLLRMGDYHGTRIVTPARLLKLAAQP